MDEASVARAEAARRKIAECDEVYTVCPGPVGPGRTGPPLGKQTLSVAEVANGTGYTGPLSSNLRMVRAESRHLSTLGGELHHLREPKSIPTSWRLPCYGSGQVEFSSCPYLARRVFGWVPNYVDVTFENVAA